MPQYECPLRDKDDDRYFSLTVEAGNPEDAMSTALVEAENDEPVGDYESAGVATLA